MVKALTIFIFFLAISAIIASCTDDGADPDPYSVGYNATCPFSYQSGCELGQQKYGQSAYDGVTGLLGGYLGYISGVTAGFACGLCESGFFGGRNTTQGDGKGGHCGSSCSNNEAECCKSRNTTQGDGKGVQCGSSCSDREAECCKNNGPQCGNNAFQEAYNVAYSHGCKTGYEIGKGNFVQGSLIPLGAYFGTIFCYSAGFLTCSSYGQALGGAQIPTNLSNILGSVFSSISRK